MRMQPESERAFAPVAAPQRCVIGVDVGTGSARAGVFDLAGQMLATAKHDITLFHAPGAIVEQSSDEIWAAVCASVRQALAGAGVAPD
jgi:D-ribulokinase